MAFYPIVLMIGFFPWPPASQGFERLQQFKEILTWMASQGIESRLL